MWLDSQDITGVDKRVLKQVGVWILGVQREVNEVEHTLSQMGVPKKLKPQPEEVMQLRRGQFFVCFEDVVKRVYVLPRWMPADVGKEIAMRLPNAEADRLMRHAIDKYQPANVRQSEGENVDYKAAYEESQQTIRKLESRIAELELMFNGRNAPKAPNVKSPPQHPRAPAAGGGEEIPLMALKKGVPEIDLTVRRYVIQADDSTLIGRIALLLTEGFFDEPRGNQDVVKELARRGKTTMAPRVSETFSKLAEMGFLLKEDEGYQSVPGMKVNVKEVSAVA